MSGKYSGELADYAKSFTDQKSDLQFLVIQKSAVTVTAMKGSVDEMSKRMDQLVQFLERKSLQEQKVADIVDRNGPATVVNVSQFRS